MARDIRDKYLDPPYTTDFGIMFLPFENIYAEVIRRTPLVEQLQREFRVIVTGPTTLGAILNSLQMGFRTLAIEKRSSEVWTVLAAVKTEFGKFGGMLEKDRRTSRQRVLSSTRCWGSVHEPSSADLGALKPFLSSSRLTSCHLAMSHSTRGRQVLSLSKSCPDLPCCNIL